jgi:hypothetical protein
VRTSRRRRTSVGGVRGRFVDLVERQLDLFAEEHVGLIGDCEAALRAYDRAPCDEAEERYGDYLDLVDAGREALVECQDAFARSLDPPQREEYEDVFARTVRKRFPRFALELD